MQWTERDEWLEVFSKGSAAIAYYTYSSNDPRNSVVNLSKLPFRPYVTVIVKPDDSREGTACRHCS